MQRIYRVGRAASMGRARRAAVLAMAMCLSLAAGCRPSSDPDTAAEPVPPTRLRVENQAFLDMTIYVYRSSQRIRLGQASGNSVTVLTIPANIVVGSIALRFQADPIGSSRASISQEITVSPGDEVILTIPPS
ncbi:MAG: hypothetical protein JWN79_317 [Gemmatimonadetes bacterium]|jgi:hypothetical protein|nr:hypothetical protein [Gemmatimonadota bacterium]